MSSCRTAVWTVIRADERSVWRDSNESRGFVPLLAHKHYIEYFSNFSYRFRGKLYRDNYRYRIIAQPYLHHIKKNPKRRTLHAFKSFQKCVIYELNTPPHHKALWAPLSKSGDCQWENVMNTMNAASLLVVNTLKFSIIFIFLIA